MIDLSFINHVELTKTSMTYIADIIIVLIAALIVYKKKTSQRKNIPVNTQAKEKPNVVITSNDIRAIAGDDVMVTQLDLARAYIELGKKKLAKQILDHVLKHGNPLQQQSARQLMASI